MAIFLLRVSAALPFDVVTWSFFAFIVACGGAFAGCVVLAWQHTRHAPEILPRAFLVLGAFSLLVLGPHYGEVRKAERFMVTADSAQGVVTSTFVRGGLRLTVTFRVDSDTYKVVGKARSQEFELREGDSVWVYFQPEAPNEALIGHPGPDPQVTRFRLAILWTIGGVLLLGYGGSLLMKRERRRPTQQMALRGTEEGAV